MAASTDMQGWELTALFMIFLLITLAWDLLVGVLTFLNNILRGRKANWLARVKEELLALGVVSLVLLFVEPTLQHICMPTSAPEEPAVPEDASPPPPAVVVLVPYGYYVCSSGTQIFPRSVIHAAHYLLFYLAIVHILFSLLTSVITNVKLSKWSILERTARKEQNIPQVAYLRISSAITRTKEMEGAHWQLKLREVWRDACGWVDQDLYSLLRFMCEKRFRAHSVVLRNFNFLNMCEQCLETELNQVYSHAWLLVFMMALLLLYNRIVYQMVWFTFVCIAMMACMAGNLRWVLNKAAREARNLWRKVNSVEGIEADDDLDAPQDSAAEVESQEGHAALEALVRNEAGGGNAVLGGWAPGGGGGGGGAKQRASANGMAGGGVKQQGAAAAAAAASPWQVANGAGGAAHGMANGHASGLGGGDPDVQTVDVAARQQGDQRLPATPNGRVPSPSTARPGTPGSGLAMGWSPRGAPSPRGGAGPLGEAAEAGGYGSAAAAAAAAVGAVADPAALHSSGGGDGGACLHGGRARATAAANRGGGAAATASCRSAAASASCRTAALACNSSTGGGGDGGGGSRLLVGWIEAARTARRAASRRQQAAVAAHKAALWGACAGAAAAACRETRGGAGEHGLQRRRGGNACGGGGGGAGALVVTPPEWLRRRPAEACGEAALLESADAAASAAATWRQAGGGDGGAAAASCSREGGGGGGPWWRPPQAARGRRGEGGRASGPVGEGTVTNPLYSPAQMAAGGGGGGGGGAQMYGGGGGGFGGVYGAATAAYGMSAAGSGAGGGMGFASQQQQQMHYGYGMYGNGGAAGSMYGNGGAAGAMYGNGGAMYGNGGGLAGASSQPLPSPGAYSPRGGMMGLTSPTMSAPAPPGGGAGLSFARGPGAPGTLYNGGGGAAAAGNGAAGAAGAGAAAKCNSGGDGNWGSKSSGEDPVAVGDLGGGGGGGGGSPRLSGSGSSSSSGSGSASGEGTGAGGEGEAGGEDGAAAAGGVSDDDGEVHSKQSMLEHELAAGIEEKITRLFFFGRPLLLLWIFNVIFAQASLTMTMSMAFIIPYDKFDSIREVSMPLYIWLPVVLTNFVLVFYGCWVFLPQYALLSVCGVLEPHEVMAEIKRSKTQDETEEGVAAVVLENLTGYFVGKHDGETRLSTAFIVSLASQAGIILGRNYKADRHINKRCLKPMYRELVMVWHDIAWYGDLTATYRIKTTAPEFREAFDELDEDGSGALSFGELANMIRSLGTYATAGDVEAMLWEIDIDNSHSIGFDEFVKFLTYAFIDTKQLGYIDTPSLMDAMERLGMPINEMQAAVLMSVGHNEPGEEVTVTLRQFFEMYEKVSFEDEDEEGEGEGGSDKGTFLGRVGAAVRTGSMALLGRLASSALIKKEGSTTSRAGGASGGAGTAAALRGVEGSAGSFAAQQRSGLSRAGTSGLGGSAGGGGGGGGSAGTSFTASARGGPAVTMPSYAPGGGGGGAAVELSGGAAGGGGGVGVGQRAWGPSSTAALATANLRQPSRLAMMSRPSEIT